MRAIEQRVARLERDPKAGAVLFAFADVGETSEAAIVRQFPGGVPGDARIVVFCWREGPPDAAGRWPQ
jgi:hypothetical protein